MSESLQDEGKRIEELIANKLNIDFILPIVGDRLERESLQRYKECETWSLRAVISEGKAPDWEQSWDNLKDRFRIQLKQELGEDKYKEFPVEQLLDSLPTALEDYLVAAVQGWRQQTFDPWANYLRYLKVNLSSRYSYNTYKCIAAQFISRYGLKHKYELKEVLDFLAGEKQRLSPRSYVTNYRMLMSFLKSLSNGEELVRQLPKPKDIKTPPVVRVFTKEEVESIIAAALVYGESLDMLARLFLSTTYGCRVGEIANFGKENVELDKGIIQIPTEKEGEIRYQAIPQGCEIFFRNGI